MSCFEYPKQMLKLMDKRMITYTRSKLCLSLAMNLSPLVKSVYQIIIFLISHETVLLSTQNIC